MKTILATLLIAFSATAAFASTHAAVAPAAVTATAPDLVVSLNSKMGPVLSSDMGGNQIVYLKEAKHTVGEVAVWLTPAVVVVAE